MVRSLKIQEELWKKKQQEEQEEQAREKVLQGALASQEEGLVHFKAQWEAIQPDLKKARQLDVQIQSQQSSYIQSQQILQAANRQVAEQEQKMRVAAEQLQVSYSSLNRLLSHVGIEEALQLEQVEEILRQEESKLAAATSTNEERLLRLNSFGYPLLAEEQVKLQKELTRQQNIRQLTETQTKAKTEIERLEKEVANCLKQLTEQETALKVTQRLYENARMAVGKDVKALRRQLQEGEACPVCGSTAHPYHQEQEVVDTLFRSIEQEYNVASTNYQQMNNRALLCNVIWRIKKRWTDRSRNSWQHYIKQGLKPETKSKYNVVWRNWQYVFWNIAIFMQNGSAAMKKLKRCVHIVKPSVRMFLSVVWLCRKYRLPKNSW